jgi:hypothetical protein
MTKKSVNKSNGYSSRRFFSFPKNGTIPASMAITTPTYGSARVCWSPILKKYFYVDNVSGGKVYSQSPDGMKTPVFSFAGFYASIHWSKTLQMLVLMTTTHIYTSTNGTDWISRTVPASYAPSYLMSTFVDASTYLLVFGGESSPGSTGYMYKTTDGITWERSESGTGTSANVVAGAIGDTVGYSNNAGDASTIRYTTNGTTYTTATGTDAAGSARSFWPPTSLRPVFLYSASGISIWGSIDGITYTNYSIGSQVTQNGTYGAYFGGMLKAEYGGPGDLTFEYLTKSATSPSFVGYVSGSGAYPDETFVSVEGEYATYTNRTKAHRVGTWLDIGEHEVWLIGGGAPNASASVGGTAGCMVIHRLTVTEKWRYCVYVYLGAAAIVDTLTGEFLAYASMLTSTSTSAQVNTAGFGSEFYPGLGAAYGNNGAACGPSNGSPGFLNLGSGYGCMTSATTTATTPPDWWTPWDFAGNPSGTGYPGTAGGTAATIGFMGASTATTVIGSFGSGGCNTSSALATVGGEPLAILYSR